MVIQLLNVFVIGIITLTKKQNIFKIKMTKLRNSTLYGVQICSFIA